MIVMASLVFVSDVKPPQLIVFKLALSMVNVFFRLLTPPGTPLFPSLEMETRKTVMSQLGTPTARPTALKSRVSIFNIAIKLSNYVNILLYV